MNDIDFFPNVEESASWLSERVKSKPSVIIVLSGGLDAFVESMQSVTTISSSDIPHFPSSRAEGHAGKIHFGKYDSVDLAVLQGRYHYYEGHDPNDIIFPYFVLNHLGAKTLITTNAVGGINKNFEPGNLMLITDHINCMGMNPLIGIAVQRETGQFTNMIDAYDEELQELVLNVAAKLDIKLKKGVYLATTGPAYETPAEIKMFRTVGADAVGMSTVPSVIAARFLNMSVLSISAIANRAADLHGGQMSHDEVLIAMNSMSPKLVKLLQGVIEEL